MILIMRARRAEPRVWARGLSAISCLLVLFVPCLPAASAELAEDSVDFPDDPFAVPSDNDQPGWIKFLILIDDPDAVIFQDSNAYPFHYDFATSEIDLFSGMSPEEFDAATLHEGEEQLAVLGAVILPPLVAGEHAIQEYGIQFLRHEPYPPIFVRDRFHAVRAHVIADPQVQAFYFPAFEQQESAEQNRAFFEAEGIPVSSTARWADGNACYSDGWALGELKYFEADQIDSAYLDGSLLAGDILLTDAVPAEIPFVAGVISLSPATPSSHVAILAETFGVPFTHLALAEDVQRAQELLGHRIVLRAYREFSGCRVRLIDVEGVLDPPTIDTILDLKDPGEIDITPVQAFGAYSAPTDGLQLTDIRHFGGKAAHFGLVRRAIPGSSPVATAFSFDLWIDFMDRMLDNGKTLRQEIQDRLAPFAYPPDMQALSATLDDVRDLIKDDDETFFGPTAEAAVLATLQDVQYGFDPDKQIRFRSSTNVEDSDRFTGAGLYDSYSGCLADDLDTDDQGPSRCDPEESKERSVFRAIRKVFASFYNFNAYLERLRHGIDENEVGMAVLAHHSFPDELELANGVGTLDRHTYSESAYLVTQAGASSVTNPDPGAIPEEVDVYIFGSGSIWPELIQPSNLVQLGATVMEMPEEYEQLTELFVSVADEYETATTRPEFTLEFEYKKLAPTGELIVKQVRPIPRPDDTPSITPFLINEPVDYCLLQGEYGDVFANHRLKSSWSLATRNLWLTEGNLRSSFFTDATLEYVEACRFHEQTGFLPGWPLFGHGFFDGTAEETWRFDHLRNPRSYELTTIGVPTQVPPSQSPLLVLRDFYCLGLRVDYDQPVPSRDHEGPITTTTDYARVCPCPISQADDLLQQRSFDDGNGVTIDTTFYWPPRPEGFTVGYTAPLVRFVETTITGLTSAPVVLHGEHSQTYRPGHHNITEDFIFDPVLEPGISRQQLDELEAAGIRSIFVSTGNVFAYHDDTSWNDTCVTCTDVDVDQDGFCAGAPDSDCDDTDADLWAAPGEIPGLVFVGETIVAWGGPAEPGGRSVVYDVLRSHDASDFTTGAVCVETGDGSDTSAEDAQEPGAGALFCYLIRASNDCPEGTGSLGRHSDGTERPGRECP